MAQHEHQQVLSVSFDVGLFNFGSIHGNNHSRSNIVKPNKTSYGVKFVKAERLCEAGGGVLSALCSATVTFGMQSPFKAAF